MRKRKWCKLLLVSAAVVLLMLAVLAFAPKKAPARPDDEWCFPDDWFDTGVFLDDPALFGAFDSRYEE